MGVMGREALVEQVMRKGWVGLSQSRREGLRLGGLRARAAVDVQWIADNNCVDGVLAQKAGHGFQIGTKRRAVDGEERLRGQA